MWQTIQSFGMFCHVVVIVTGASGGLGAPLAGGLDAFTSAVAFLLAPGYVNGQVPALDGGLTT